MSNLRAGLIGMGMMGKNHARILSKLNGVDFIGVVDPIKSENSLAESGGVKVFHGLDQLLSENLDYCVIAAPTGFHREIAVEMLNAGVHCLIEKPVATDIKSALEVQRAAVKNSRVVGIGHIERYNAAIRQLKSKLQSNELGKIYQISLVRQGPFPSRIAGVGVVRDLATHDIDLSMWLTESQYSSISAQTSKIKTLEYEDLVSITGRLKNDVVVNMVTNWLSPYKVRSIVVLGENGAFHADTLNSDLTHYRNGTITTSHDVVAHFRGLVEGDATKFSFEKIEPLLLEHENFRNHLIGKSSEIVTIEEGIETIKISDAIIRIGKTGESEKF